MLTAMIRYSANDAWLWSLLKIFHRDRFGIDRKSHGSIEIKHSGLVVKESLRSDNHNLE